MRKCHVAVAVVDVNAVVTVVAIIACAVVVTYMFLYVRHLS